MLPKASVVAIALSLLLLCYTNWNYEHEVVLGQPVHTAILILPWVYFVLLLPSEYLSRLLPFAHGNRDASDGSDVAIGSRDTLAGASRWHALNAFASGPEIRLTVLILIRFYVSNLVQYGSACFILSSKQEWLPMIFALYDYRYSRAARSLEYSRRSSNVGEDQWGMPKRQTKRATPVRADIICALLLGIAGTLRARTLSKPVSTYICSQTYQAYALSELLQACVLLIDALIIRELVSTLKAPARSSLLQTSRSSILYIWITLSALFIFNVLAPGSALSLGELRRHCTPSILKWSITATFGTVCYLRILSDFGAFHTTFWALGTNVVCSTLVYIFSPLDLRPDSNRSVVACFALCLCSSVILYSTTSSEAGSITQRRRAIRPRKIISVSILLLLSTSASCYFLWQSSPSLQKHPIDNLLTSGATDSKTWLTQASRGLTLNAAAENYKDRYGRLPPPAFKEWYEFATQRHSTVIDDFDSINDDLKAFWAMTPSEIRKRTREVTVTGENEIAIFRIRNGGFETAHLFKPKHKALIEGFKHMANDFVQHIPDMDIALNLDPNPRVAVPHNAMQGYLAAAPAPKVPVEAYDGWCKDRFLAWGTDGRAAQPLELTRLSSFDAYAASIAACPPLSAAQGRQDWDTKTLYPKDVEQHSESTFMINSTAAASPCHQADLFNLHELFVGSNSLSVTNELMPVFSLRKTAGFADIIYPSALDYLSSPKCAPTVENPDAPFSEKADSLYWRGDAPSTGSRSDRWRGMLPQRLVNLAQAITASKAFNRHAVTLPDPDLEGRYTVQYPSKPESHISTFLNLFFFSLPPPNTPDGKAQHAHFDPPPSRTPDFQAHWANRYIVSLDNKNLLPFLHSRSLPFLASIYQTWYTPRLTAWAHYIPIDIRLHGLLSTIAFFSGTNGDKRARTMKGRVGMEARVKAAEEVAERGREWVGKAVRWEDAQVYLFRLLLEWGRLTDDRRDDLGFEVPKAAPENSNMGGNVA